MPCRMRKPSAEEGPSSAAAWPNRIVSVLTPASSLRAADAANAASTTARTMHVAERTGVMTKLIGDLRELRENDSAAVRNCKADLAPYYCGESVQIVSTMRRVAGEKLTKPRSRARRRKE